MTEANGMRPLFAAVHAYFVRVSALRGVDGIAAATAPVHAYFVRVSALASLRRDIIEAQGPR